jgi:hypothetical protein
MLRKAHKREVILFLIIINIIITPIVLADKITIGDSKTTILTPSSDETCTPIINETMITREECINWTMPSPQNPLVQTPTCNEYGNVTKPHFTTTQECSRNLYGEVRYYDYGKGYELINTTIKTSDNSNYSHMMNNGLYTAYFKNDSYTTKSTRFIKGGYYFDFDIGQSQAQWYKAPNATYPNGVVMGGILNPVHNNITIIGTNKVIYPNAWSGVNITYDLLNEQIKETLTINNSGSIPAPVETAMTADYFRYKINVYYTNTLRVCLDNNSCYLNPSNINIITQGRINFKNSTNNQTIFYLPQPTITDANNNTYDATYFINLNNGIDLWYISIPKSTIQNATYPVKIDPTITLNTPNSQVIDDTYTDSLNSDSAGGGTWDNLKLRNFTPQSQRGLLKLNVSSINSNSRIISATVNLYKIWTETGLSTDTANISIYSVYANYSWSEETATWNNQPAEGNYNTTALSVINFSYNSPNATYSWNVTPAIINATGDNRTNISFYFIVYTGNTNGLIYTFGSKENTNASVRPYMNITYQYTSNQTITNCTDLDSPGITYFLNNDINNTNYTTCFNVLANNTILDCQGHTINGNSAANGVYASASYGTVNMTIRNCTFYNMSGGIGAYYSFDVKNWSISNVVINLTSTALFGNLLYAGGLVLTNITFDYSRFPAISSSTGGTHCSLTMNNVTGDNDLPIIYYENANGLDLANWYLNSSDIIFCNVSNSRITNLTTNSYMTIYLSDYINITNTTLTAKVFNMMYSGNLTIKNVVLKNSSLGQAADLQYSNNLSISNSIFNTSLYPRFYTNIIYNNITLRSYPIFYHVDNLLISNSTFNTTYDPSFTIMSSNNIKLYNNFLRTPSTYRGASTTQADWNTTLAAGTRIFGFGSLVGGNYYTFPNASGYSDTCNDTDFNGICDQPFNVANITGCVVGVNCPEYDVDYFPLSKINYTPSVTITGPVDSNWTNDNTTDITFIVNDLLSDSINCTVLLNGTSYGNGAVNNNTPATITTSAIPDNTNYSLVVNCSDSLVGVNTNSFNSSSQVLHVDASVPVISLAATFNLTTAYYNSTLGCNFSFIDNLGSFKLFNYSFYVNNSEKYSNTSQNLTNNSVFFTNSFRGNFSRNHNVSCNVSVWDLANNQANTSVLITISNTAPVPVNVTMSPLPVTGLDELTCLFNYTDNDNDALDTAYYNWTLDGIISTYHTSSIGAGNLTAVGYANCSVMVSDGYDNSSEVFSPTSFVSDITPPVLSGTTLSQFTGSTVGVYYVYANCTDSQSSIGLNYPKVVFNDPTGVLQGNYTLTHYVGSMYRYSASFSTEGSYENFTFYCRDAQNNLDTLTNTNLSFLASTGGSGSPGGGGGSRETQVVIQNITLASFCGDGTCDADENPLKCSQDCSINVENAINCLWTDPKSCFYSKTWFITVIFIVVVLSGLLLIYAEVNKKDPGWLRKWF